MNSCYFLLQEKVKKKNFFKHYIIVESLESVNVMEEKNFYRKKNIQKF